MAFGKFKTLANIVNGFVMDFVNLSAFITVGYLLYKGEITIGTGIATFGYLESFIYPIRYILNDINDISASKETKDSVLSFMNEREENDLALMQRFEQSIAFENVEISFKDFAVRNFSYTFEKGKKYAIIGHSGSGKSTIVNALMKYTEIERGTIKIDGQSIQQTDLSSICCCIDQSFYTFADNFQNNVSTFHAYSTNHLEHLLGKYQWGKLKKIKDEDNMQSLSGGEKQMLHLLHLFTVNAPICLLDEPFSAMDAKMTGEMQKALLELTEQTVILVTHKITKEHLEEFDEIIIMENGFVVGAGTYKDIERSLAYMSLLKSA